MDYKTIDWNLVSEQTDDVSGEVYKEQEGLRLIKGGFDNAPGATFWVPEIRSIEAMTALYTQETVLSLINTALNSGLRIKARGKLPKYEDAAEQAKAYEKIKTEGLVILNEADAVNYVPGERELSAQGYMRLANKEVAKGNKAAALALMQKAMAATEREMALLV